MEKEIPKTIDDLDSTEQFQVMESLSVDEYEALKSNIADDGINVPIAITPDLRIIDGHHRAKAARELGLTIEDVPMTTIEKESDGEYRKKAWELNMSRRNVGRSEKRGLVKSYFQNDWDGESYREIGELLGVSKSTVSVAKNELQEEGVDVTPNVEEEDGGDKSFDAERFITSEERQEAVREYISENPDASDRSIAKDTGISQPTVGSVRGDIEDAERDVEMLLDTPDDIGAVERSRAIENVTNVLDYTKTDIANEIGIGKGKMSRWTDPSMWDIELTDDVAALMDSIGMMKTQHIRRALNNSETESTTEHGRRALELADEHDVSSRECKSIDPPVIEALAAFAPTPERDEDEDNDSESGIGYPEPDEFTAVIVKNESDSDEPVEPEGDDAEPDTEPADTTADAAVEPASIESAPTVTADEATCDHADDETLEPTGPSREEIEDFEQNLDKIQSEIEEIGEDPRVKRNGRLLRNLSKHMLAEVLRQRDIRCPECGGGVENLEWTCCDISLMEAMDIAREKSEEQMEEIYDEKLKDILNPNEVHQ